MIVCVGCDTVLLFESLRGVPGNELLEERRRGAACAHEGRNPHRRRGHPSGVGYRGTFQSSVHPVCLPLNLSEVYVLFDALAEYVREKDGQDPHRKTAERLAGMVKSQLSDYAKERLQTRLKEMRLDGLEEVAPLYAPDSPSGNAQGEKADPLHWMRFEKMGIRVEVERNDGSLVTGTILSGAAAREFIEEHNVKRKDKRARLIVRRTDDDYDIAPWAEVVDVRRAV